MFQKILVPVDIDYPKTAALVYRKAVEIGGLNNAEIRLVSVMPGFGMPIVASYIPENVLKDAKDNYKETLETFVTENCNDGVKYFLKTGKAWEQIVKVADKWEADLIVVYYNRRREINEMFSNSCSQRVMENANCSVLRLRNIRD